jgi:hypothetical protein
MCYAYGMTTTYPTCDQCGRDMYHQRAGARYCSPACKQKAYRTRNAPRVTPTPVTPAVTLDPADHVPYDRKAPVTERVTATPAVTLDPADHVPYDRKAPVTERVTANSRMPLHLACWWGGLSSMVGQELGKPEGEPIEVRRRDLQMLAAWMNWITTHVDLGIDTPDAMTDELVAIHHDEAIRQKYQESALLDSSVEEATEFIAVLKEHIKELKQEARRAARESRW